MDDTFETSSPGAIDSKISEAIIQQVGGIDDLSVRGTWTNGDNGLYSVAIVYTIQGKPQPPLSLSLVI